MPNRIIKETIRTSKSVNALSDADFRFWVYLITYVDDYGCGSADPELLKGFVFPRRHDIQPADITNALNRLSDAGMIVLYIADDEPYFYFPNWSSHQQIRAKKRKFPEPVNICNQLISDDIGCARNPIQSNPNPNPNTESNTSARQKSLVSRDADFDRFWDAYPNKVGKKAARTAFAKVKVPIEVLLEAIEKQKGWERWTKDGGRYIPNPSTWLNQGRWEDEDSGTSNTHRAKAPGEYKGRDFFDDE